MLRQTLPLTAMKCLTVSAFALAAGVSHHAQAEDILLTNPSFETPDIAIPGPGASPADVVLPFFQFPAPAPFNPLDWQETGEEDTEQGFTGLLDAGVFLNIPFDLGGGFVIPAVPNAHPFDATPENPNQLAYMRYSAAANAPGGTPTTISQRTTVEFEPFTEYTFTISLGIGTLQPPGSSDPGDPWTVILSIGTYDDDALAENGFTPWGASVPVTIGEMNPDGSLKDFSVTVSVDDAVPVGNVMIHAQQSGGSTGSVNLDNARLTKTVIPEPASLALLGLGGLLVSRRRR